MSTSPEQHRKTAPRTIACAVVTVSDTRTLDTDLGGRLVADLLDSAGHVVISRDIVRDEPVEIQSLIEPLIARRDVQAILLTGGTGISRRDQTYETVMRLLDKVLSGYGELFRMLSFQEIGPAAMLSRATGGIARGKILMTMPGSPAAVRLAMERLILPELGHLVAECEKG